MSEIIFNLAKVAAAAAEKLLTTTPDTFDYLITESFSFHPSRNELKDDALSADLTGRIKTLSFRNNPLRIFHSGSSISADFHSAFAAEHISLF